MANLNSARGYDQDTKKLVGVEQPSEKNQKHLIVANEPRMQDS